MKGCTRFVRNWDAAPGGGGGRYECMYDMKTNLLFEDTVLSGSGEASWMECSILRGC